MQPSRTHLLCTLVLIACPTLCQAQLTSPQVGWIAQLSREFHDVSGLITVLDEDTLLVQDFTYDGGGPTVYFYLGSEDTAAAYNSGLEIGSLLTGTVYDGTQEDFEIDLPSGQTLEGWNAISVWCSDFSVNFGSGTFLDQVIVDQPADFNDDLYVDGLDLGIFLGNWGSTTATIEQGELNGVPPVDGLDLGILLGAWNPPPLASTIVVPEPATTVLLLLGGMGLLYSRAC